MRKEKKKESPMSLFNLELLSCWKPSKKKLQRFKSSTTPSSSWKIRNAPSSQHVRIQLKFIQLWVTNVQHTRRRKKAFHSSQMWSSRSTVFRMWDKTICLQALRRFSEASTRALFELVNAISRRKRIRNWNHEVNLNYQARRRKSIIKVSKFRLQSKRRKLRSHHATSLSEKTSERRRRLKICQLKTLSTLKLDIIIEEQCSRASLLVK